MQGISFNTINTNTQLSKLTTHKPKLYFRGGDDQKAQTNNSNNSGDSYERLDEEAKEKAQREKSDAEANALIDKATGHFKPTIPPLPPPPPPKYESAFANRSKR